MRLIYDADVKPRNLLSFMRFVDDGSGIWSWSMESFEAWFQPVKQLSVGYYNLDLTMCAKLLIFLSSWTFRTNLLMGSSSPICTVSLPMRTGIWIIRAFIRDTSSEVLWTHAVYATDALSMIMIYFRSGSSNYAHFLLHRTTLKN